MRRPDMPDAPFTVPDAKHMRPASSSYHAHLYWHDAAGRTTADRLCRALAERFGAVPGTRREVAGGPHPAPELHVGFPLARFGELVPWLMLSRGELSVLVHPETGDALADHTAHALWLGPPLPINLDAL